MHAIASLTSRRHTQCLFRRVVYVCVRFVCNSLSAVDMSSRDKAKIQALEQITASYRAANAELLHQLGVKEKEKRLLEPLLSGLDFDVVQEREKALQVSFCLVLLRCTLHPSYTPVLRMSPIIHVLPNGETASTCG